MKKTIIALLLILTAISGFYLTRESSSASGLDYFKGKWTVTMRNNPKMSFSWTVKEDLNESWLAGVVETGGQRITNDFWRQNNQKIERFAFTTGSTFVRLESAGWNGNQMIFNGILSDASGETKVRETITKTSERQFNALWEREENGKWVVFGDEICTKQ